MKILTDTHTLVWALTAPENLGAKAYSALAGSAYTASVANLWELVLKANKPGELLIDPNLLVPADTLTGPAIYLNLFAGGQFSRDGVTIAVK